MEKPKINFQDQFLNIARKERLKVEVELISGARIKGYIKSFDSFCLLVEGEGETGEQLVYKHATARVVLAEGQVLRKDVT